MDSTTDRSRVTLEDDAASWLQRRDLGPWDSSDDAALTQWLEACTANRVTFLRLEAAWDEVGRLRVLASGFPRRRVPSAEELTLSPRLGEDRSRGGIRSYNSWWMRALAATVVFAVGAGYFAYLRFQGDGYATPVGGLTSIPLTDGSSIALNTASKVRVRLTDSERHVTLDAGEAYFEVAHDSTRPFTVTAGGKTITALGTAFSVRRDRDDVRVIVTDGSVRVEEGAAGVKTPTLLTAGEVAHMQKDAVEQIKQAATDIDATLAWRTGYLVFHDAPLAEAVAEFNRYNARQIDIADSTIQSIRLTGKFRATNTDALARLLEKSFRVSVQHSENRILLSAQPAAP